MFSKELGESRDGDVAFVFSVGCAQDIERRHGSDRGDGSRFLGRRWSVCEDSLGGLELGERWAVVTWVRDTGEGLARR